MKKIIISILLAVCICFASACTPAGYPIKVGETEISFRPKRVVCLDETTASIISELGYAEKIVGAPKTAIESAELTATDIGTAFELFTETIISLKPDLIITSFEIKTTLKNLFAQNKITVLKVENPNSVAELKILRTEFFGLFEGEKKAPKKEKEYSKAFDARVLEMKNKNSAVTKKAVLYIENGFVATGDSIFGSLLTEIGITNIAQEKMGYIMSDSEVAALSPDVIFCAKGMGDLLMKTEALASTPAVLNGAVYEVKVESLYACGKNLLPTLEEMTNFFIK